MFIAFNCQANFISMTTHQTEVLTKFCQKLGDTKIETIKKI